VSRFPGNKRFAFTILDDTDYASVGNVEPVYRFLADIGIFTTKTVWPLSTSREQPVGGASLAENDYLELVRWMKKAGFEIALHGVRNQTSSRDVVKKGLETFRELLGSYPRTHCNHFANLDNLYWGPERFSTALPRMGFALAKRFGLRGDFQGHLESSQYFWGDLCRERISYVRNLVFQEINLERINPTLPYSNPRQPFVNYWFSSSFGDKLNSFCRMLREENQDRLEEEEGVCIMYTHFGLHFYENGELNQEFVRLMRRLAQKNGWFVPVATLLDHLLSRNKNPTISRSELNRLERRWLRERLLRRDN
jgi:hypothetical protein